MIDGKVLWIEVERYDWHHAQMVCLRLQPVLFPHRFLTEIHASQIDDAVATWAANKLLINHMDVTVYSTHIAVPVVHPGLMRGDHE